MDAKPRNIEQSRKWKHICKTQVLRIHSQKNVGVATLIYIYMSNLHVCSYNFMHQSCKHFGAFQRHSQPSHVAKPSVTEVKVSYVLVQCPVCATNCRGCPVGVETAWCHLVMPQPGMHVLFDLLGCLLCGCIIPVEGHKFLNLSDFFPQNMWGNFHLCLSFLWLPLGSWLCRTLCYLCVFQPPFFWVCFLPLSWLSFQQLSHGMALMVFSALPLQVPLNAAVPRAPVHGHPCFLWTPSVVCVSFQHFEALPMLSCRLPKHRHQNGMPMFPNPLCPTPRLVGPTHHTNFVHTNLRCSPGLSFHCLLVFSL